nr:cytochrome P450 9AZ2 [Pagiophloeus tsushimanus]
MILIVAVLVAAVAVWYYLVKPLSYWSDLGVKQIRPWLIFKSALNNFYRTMGDGEFVEYFYNLYPNERFIGMYNVTNPTLFIKDPELIKQFGVKDFDSFSDHIIRVDPDADPIFSKNLLSLEGEKWKEMRNVLSPTFSSSKIKSIFLLMIETAENFVNYLNTKDDDVIELEMKDAYRRFTNDVIATTAFGVKVDSLQNKQNTFYEMGKRLTNIGGVLITLRMFACQVLPKFSKFLGMKLFDATATNYFSVVMNDTIKAREEKNIVRLDMVNHLLEARKKRSHQSSENRNLEGRSKPVMEFSNEDITAQAVLFFFGGFDTVSTALSFGSYELALNKDVQDKLRKEIRGAAKNGKIDYDTLQKMSYLDQFTSEILRKWAPFPSTDRLCTKPYTLKLSDKKGDTITLRKGDELLIPIHAIHRDPKYFPNPDKFDPERFSEENKDNIVPYTYLPFGFGPRICIGNRFALIEIKALFSLMLLNYEIIPTKKTVIPPVLNEELQLSAKGGLWMGLKRIKS